MTEARIDDARPDAPRGAPQDAPQDLTAVRPGGHAAAVPPSPWVTRWAHLIAPGGRVLDLACGGGRHARWLAASGFEVLAVDRDAAALATLPPGIATRAVDLEQGTWPLAGEAPFAAIVVTNYLHRPLWPHLLGALVPGGVLLYETFAAGNETLGKPSNPDFLLKPGELLDVARGALRVVGYEDGVVDAPKPAFVQRICAVREAPRESLGGVSETVSPGVPGGAPHAYRLPR